MSLSPELISKITEFYYGPYIILKTTKQISTDYSGSSTNKPEIINEYVNSINLKETEDGTLFNVNIGDNRTIRLRVIQWVDNKQRVHKSIVDGYKFVPVKEFLRDIEYIEDTGIKTHKYGYVEFYETKKEILAYFKILIKNRFLYENTHFNIDNISYTDDNIIDPKNMCFISYDEYSPNKYNLLIDIISIFLKKKKKKQGSRQKIRYGLDYIHKYDDPHKFRMYKDTIIGALVSGNRKNMTLVKLLN